MSNGGIVFVELVELALFEEDNRIPQVLLDSPILLLEGRELVPG
jgi:hypothetical protein